MEGFDKLIKYKQPAGCAVRVDIAGHLSVNCVVEWARCNTD
jgi:hypothetical protein